LPTLLCVSPFLREINPVKLLELKLGQLKSSMRGD